MNDAIRIQRDVAVALSATSEIVEALQILLDGLLGFSSLDAGGVYLVDEQTGDLELAASTGLAPEFVERERRVPADDPRAVQALSGVAHYQSREEVRANRDAKALEALGIRSIATLPVCRGGRVLALVNLVSYGRDTISESVRLALEGITAQLGATIARIRTEQGERTRLLAEHQARTACLQAEGRFQAIVQASPLGIQLYRLEGSDQQLVFDGANPAADRILGLSHAAFVGALLEDVFPALVATEVPDRLRRACSAGDSWQSEQFIYEHLPRRGVFQVFVFQTSPGRGAMMLHDITDDRRREAHSRQQQKLEAIGTLASGVAHEINNPLNVIMNFAQLVYNRAESDSPFRTYATEIIHESERVASIVKDLLSFSRLEKESNQPCDVAALIQSTLRLLSTVVKRDRILLTVEVAPGLPGIPGRQQQIQQVLLNLLTNARDALNQRWPDGGPQKRITVRAHELQQDGERWVRITVEDQGTGLDPALGERIFDPFFTTKPRDKGTGLGLAVSYGIAREHHGRLSFDSTPGEGCTFQLDLPVAFRPLGTATLEAP